MKSNRTFNPHLRVDEHHCQSMSASIIAQSVVCSDPIRVRHEPRKNRFIKPPVNASQDHTGLTVCPQPCHLCRGLSLCPALQPAAPPIGPGKQNAIADDEEPAQTQAGIVHKTII